jgi:hypothetical protein
MAVVYSLTFFYVNRVGGLADLIKFANLYADAYFKPENYQL